MTIKFVAVNDNRTWVTDLRSYLLTNKQIGVSFQNFAAVFFLKKWAEFPWFSQIVLLYSPPWFRTVLECPINLLSNIQ